ncbi:MAG: DUF192 domain-containing protein [Chloroflexota bacterium]
MKYVSINILNRPQSRLIVAHYADSFLSRLRGLMFRRSIPLNRGLLLVQGHDSRMDSSIHMMFVWMDLAVVWINQAGEVVDTCLARAWRPAYFPKAPARYILEMAAAHHGDFQIGDQIRFDEAWLDP